MSDRPITVHYGPEHEAHVFDDRQTPMLTFVQNYPNHGPGWLLSYMERDGSGVDDHFIPGDITTLDEAVESARRWLDLVDNQP